MGGVDMQMGEVGLDGGCVLGTGSAGFGRLAQQARAVGSTDGGVLYGAMDELLESVKRQWWVIDVLQGTTLGEHGKKEGCGLWLMQQVVPGDAVQEWAAGCEKNVLAVRNSDESGQEGGGLPVHSGGGPGRMPMR